jgi:hypothetical protein
MKQRSKSSALTYIVIAILCLIGLGIKKCRNSPDKNPERTVTTAEGDWRHHKLIYTKHARCRMECRDITENEVEYVLANGTVNESKSNEADEEAEGHCPTFALESKTNDGQNVRIIFGACDKITKVVTVIDLGEEHECNCR